MDTGYASEERNNSRMISKFLSKAVMLTAKFYGIFSGRRRPELPKPPPYSELPPEYTSVADSNVYHTGLCVHTGQSNYTAQSRFHGHSRRGGQSNNIDSTIDLQHQGVAEYGYSSLPRPDRNNAGLYPPPTPSTSASVSSLDCRPTQRLLQKNNQKERSTNKRKTTHIPVLTTRSKRQTDTASTSSTRAASTSTAGESVSTIESLPGMPLPDEQKPVSNREQRDVSRTAILKKLQLRKADLETMSGEYI